MEKNDFQLPSSVLTTINDLFPSNNPLDSQDFDPIDYMNRYFPTEQSLNELDSFILSVRHQIDTLDTELSEAIHEQSQLSQQAMKDLQESKTATKLLASKIKDVHQKATQSENMINELCRDIVQLDVAKNHLNTSVEALQKIYVLNTSLEQLDQTVTNRKYHELSHLLDTTHGILNYFKDYEKIEKIRVSKAHLESIEDHIVKQIIEDFQAVGKLEELVIEENEGKKQQEGGLSQTNKHQNVLKHLANGAKIMGIIEKRQVLLETFAKEQLEEYEKMYGAHNEETKLDNIHKRLAWYYTKMKNIEKQTQMIFPSEWEVQRYLSIRFCTITREHLVKELGAIAPEEMDVTSLLKALQKIIAFEKNLEEKYDKNGGKQEEKILDENGNELDVTTSEGIKAKYKQKKRNEEAKKQLETVSATSEKSNKQQDKPSFSRILSSIFEPYMTSYIAYEHKNIENTINETVSNDVIDRNGPLPVLSSSIQLFICVRNAMKRCLCFSHGQVFYNLYQEFKTEIQYYCDALQKKLPVFNTVSPVFTELMVRLTRADEETISFIINTCEYCIDTLPTLEEAIKSKIDTVYVESIDFQQVMEGFYNLENYALKCLVQGIEMRLEGAFNSIVKGPWATLEAVGDESPYIREISEVLLDVIPNLREMLSNLYFVHFCDKFSTALLQTYLETILKCKRINEMAVQQLLLNTHGLKSVLLKMPILEKDPGSKKSNEIPVRYTKMVNKEVTHVEIVLKLIGTPMEMLVESFRVMLPDSSPAVLQEILNAKGIRKNEQQTIMDAFGDAYKPPTVENEDEKTTENKTTSNTTSLNAVAVLFGTSISETSRPNLLPTISKFAVKSSRWSNEENKRQFKFGF